MKTAKHFNEKHEVIIKTNFVEQRKSGKDYKTGDKVTLKEVVNNTEHYIETDEGIQKIWLHRDLIIDLYNQITEIEKNKIEGEIEFDFPF